MGLLNETYNDAIGQRGGITVRDYTQGNRPPSLSERIQSEGVRGVFDRINFDRIARGLIWASMGLGVLELVAPKRVQKLAGVRGDYSGLIRILGLREIASGLLIFMQARPHQAVWSRVVGDAIDLSLLGAASASPRTRKNRLAAVTASILGITLVDMLTASQLTRVRSEERVYSTITDRDLSGRLNNGAFRVTKSITINRPAEELYAFWRNFENLPQFMFHLQAVRVLDERRSHWVTQAPGGSQVEWDAVITEDQPNQMIAWETTENADVWNSGRVYFRPAPGNRGTVVQVEIEYRPPAGAIGKFIARLFGEEPGQQVAGDLRRFKQVVETGEVVLSEGNPEGFGKKMQRPAQPAAERSMA
jgi:uncharacterized membrane protein